MIFVNLKSKNTNVIQCNQAAETGGHGCVSSYCCYPFLVEGDIKSTSYSVVLKFYLFFSHTIHPDHSHPSLFSFQSLPNSPSHWD